MTQKMKKTDKKGWEKKLEAVLTMPKDPDPVSRLLLVGHVTYTVVVDMIGLQFTKPLTTDSLVMALQSMDMVCDEGIHWPGQVRAAANSFRPPLLAKDYGEDI
jgi:hypothetical protein